MDLLVFFVSVSFWFVFGGGASVVGGGEFWYAPLAFPLFDFMFLKPSALCCFSGCFVVVGGCGVVYGDCSSFGFGSDFSMFVLPNVDEGSVHPMDDLPCLPVPWRHLRASET